MRRGRREKLLREEEEQEKIRNKGKGKEAGSFQLDEADDDEDLDEFENDGFIVDDTEDEEEEGESPRQTQKKRKRKSLKSTVLDDEDLELIRENKIINPKTSRDGKFKRLRKAGVDSELMEYSSDDGGSLFDSIDAQDEEDAMADFIVDEEADIYGKGHSLRPKMFKDRKHSSSLSKEAEHSFGKVGRLEVQTQPTNMYGAGEDNSDTDIPERMQIIEDMIGSPIDRMSIEEESSWILSQLTSDINPLSSEAKSCRLFNTSKREDIINFLELHHSSKYDIPFIAMYRKEQCLSLLEDPRLDESENILLKDFERTHKLKWHKMLWMIKELDTKWLLLQKRKSMLMRYYNTHFEEESQMSFLVEESSFHKQVFDSITNMLQKAETESEIDDIDRKFNLYFPPAEEFSDNGFKRPLTKSYYSNCNKAGLWPLACKFGNPEKFGSLVTLEKVGANNEEDPLESPDEMASVYKCETFQTSEAVLKGARHMAGVMLTSDIPFRKYVRTIFMNKALVSTSPTLEGNIRIDSFHEFAGVKWLRDKPLSKFEDSQWLFIQKAEQEKLLQVKMQLPDQTMNELTMACNDAYLKVSGGISTGLWNEQRKLILQDAISNILLPSMEKEARVLLNAKAKNWALMKYAMQLWNRVCVAPYLNNENGTAQQKGVMTCCWGNGKPGTAFVMLDSGGDVVDVMHAQSLALRSQNIIVQQSRKNDQQRVLRFLTIYQPCVIILGAANESCLRLREDIDEIISMMSEHNFEDLSKGMKGRPAVVLAEEGLPCLYEDSEISTSQLPRQHGIVKRAVALGRYLLNPLAMVATLCGEKKEIVSWKLTPLERFLTSDEKLRIIEWVMTDVTNQVGIDINLSIRHDWLLAPLQFVSGLGPKTASIVQRELLGGTEVRNRRDFAKVGLNRKNIFCNTVGFLRVSCDDENFVDSVGNTLDHTRIHPESYNLAGELAIAVYRKHVENPEPDVTEVNAIECIQNDPNLLECFDLNEYSDRLEIEKGEYKRETLFDIKMELLHGFKDPRRPYIEPTQEEEFCMITGETGDMLVEGKKVQATVRHVLSQLAFCVLDSGMTGVIFKDDFSDDTENISLTDKLREGAVLTCKIKLIDKNKCRVNLTCKVSELKDGEGSFHDMDPYYHEGNNNSLSQLEGTDKIEHGNKHFILRMISHPNFQNITSDQARQILADQDVGEYIFHPSSRGPCCLTLSLKFFNGVYVHKDIAETGKSIKNLLGLGKTLKVGEEVFEDINQVIEHYVNPLVVHLKAMINFRKFMKGSKAEVDELLKLKKDKCPNWIPYGFGISYEHPGTFVLSYIRSTNPHHEIVAIHPKGFKFRKQIFKNIEELVAYFQNHINDKVALAKVGSFRESMSGGWRSNNVDQHKQSIADNEYGNGRDAGRSGGRCRGRGGWGRGFGPRFGSSDDCTSDGKDGDSFPGGNGRGGRGRGCRGRGRGFGPRPGSRDDCSGDGKDDNSFPSSSWGFGSRDTPDESFAAGKSWKVSDSGEGNGGRQGRGRGRGSQGDSKGCVPWGGNSHESGRHSDGGGWGQGQDEGRGRGWGRGSQGNDQGRGRWGGNNSNEEWNRDEDRIGKGSWGLSNDGNANGGYSDGNNGSGWGQSHDQGRGRGRGRGSPGNGQGRGRWGGNNSNEEWDKDSTGNSSWGQGQDQGRGRGRRGGPGNGQGRGRGRWGGNNTNEERDKDNTGNSSWGQGQDRGRGRGRRGGPGNGQGCGRWGGNNTNEERDKDSTGNSSWGQSQDRGRGRGRRGGPGNGQGRGRWGGNNTNEERNWGEDNRGKGRWGASDGGVNGGSGNENSGWGGAQWNNATPSKEGSGWGGTSWG